MSYSTVEHMKTVSPDMLKAMSFLAANFDAFCYKYDEIQEAITAYTESMEQLKETFDEIVYLIQDLEPLLSGNVDFPDDVTIPGD